MFELIDFLIVNPIVNILLVIYNFVGDFGLAIILFTILVKLLIWPLTKRQIHQTKSMRQMQPELAEIRKRAGGDKRLESIEMMNLYKKYNIKPMGSIWTLLIQLPIFFALFLAIRVMVTPTTSDYIEKRAYPFVLEMDRIHDIAEKQKPYIEYQSKVAAAPEEEKEKIEVVNYDFEPKLFGVVDLGVRPGFTSVSAIVVMFFALASAFMQYWISKSQQPKQKKGGFKSSFSKMMADAKAGKDPSQEDMSAMVSGQMSIMMPLMMLFIMLGLPGALVFYYLLSNIISVVQQKYILGKIDDALDDTADRAVLSELKKKNKLLEKLGVKDVKEAEVISGTSAKKTTKTKSSSKPQRNKKTGTTTRVIRASDLKKDNNQKSTSNTSHQSNQPKNG